VFKTRNLTHAYNLTRSAVKGCSRSGNDFQRLPAYVPPLPPSLPIPSPSLPSPPISLPYPPNLFLALTPRSHAAWISPRASHASLQTNRQQRSPRGMHARIILRVKPSLAALPRGSRRLSHPARWCCAHVTRQHQRCFPSRVRHASSPCARLHNADATHIARISASCLRSLSLLHPHPPTAHERLTSPRAAVTACTPSTWRANGAAPTGSSGRHMTPRFPPALLCCLRSSSCWHRSYLSRRGLQRGRECPVEACASCSVFLLHFAWRPLTLQESCESVAKLHSSALFLAMPLQARPRQRAAVTRHRFPTPHLASTAAFECAVTRQFLFAVNLIVQATASDVADVSSETGG
jgi:hypothetical protein